MRRRPLDDKAAAAAAQARAYKENGVPCIVSKELAGCGDYEQAPGREDGIFETLNLARAACVPCPQHVLGSLSCLCFPAAARWEVVCMCRRQRLTRTRRRAFLVSFQSDGGSREDSVWRAVLHTQEPGNAVISGQCVARLIQVRTQLARRPQRRGAVASSVLSLSLPHAPRLTAFDHTPLWLFGLQSTSEQSPRSSEARC